mgnify:FL=1
MKAFIVFTLIISLSNIAFTEDAFKVTGKVIDSITKEPIEGVLVKVKEGKLATYTSKDGEFSFEIPPYPPLLKGAEKDVTILAQAGGYSAYTKTIQLPVQHFTIELELSTEFTFGQIYVRDKHKRIEGSKKKVKSEQIQKATTHLFSDTLKLVQTFPGVVTGNDFSSLMYIRGGEFYESISFLDNVYLMMPYMWGGNQSIFNPSFVDTVDFYSGGFPSKYPQALSGVIDVKNIEGHYEKTNGFAEMSAASLEGFIQGPMETDKSSYVFGVRRTYYDLILNLLQPDKDIVTPFFYDAQSKITWKLDDKNKLYFNTLSSYEGMDWEMEGTESEFIKKGDAFHYRDSRALPSLNWEHIANNKLSLGLTLSYRYQNGSYQWKGTNSNFDAKQQFQEIFFRDKIEYLYENHHFEQGIYVFTTWVNSNSNVKYRTLMPKGTYITTERSAQYNWIPFTATGIYLQDDIELISKLLFLNVGSSVEYFDYTKDKTFAPKAGIKIDLTEDTTLKFNTGLYTQFPVFAGNNEPPILRNSSLKSEKAMHYVVGIEHNLSESYFLRIEGYQKDYYDRVISDPDPNLYYTNNGIRRTKGIDVFLQKKISTQWDGWLAYSYLTAEDKITKRSNPEDFSNRSSLDYQEPVNEWFTFSKERKHNISIMLNYEFVPKWKIASTYRFSTGTPYTPVSGAQNFNGVYVPNYGAYLSEILPNYHRLDFKFTMPFFGIENMESFIQTINTFGNKNIDHYYYSEDYTKREEATMLPFLFIGGIRYNF